MQSNATSHAPRLRRMVHDSSAENEGDCRIAPQREHRSSPQGPSARRSCPSMHRIQPLCGRRPRERAAFDPLVENPLEGGKPEVSSEALFSEARPPQSSLRIGRSAEGAPSPWQISH